MSPEITEFLDSIEVSLNAGGMETINIVLAFVMYGVALGIKPKTFANIYHHPKSAMVGAFSQLILLPLFTFLLTLALGDNITWTMAMGMILVASCPGGNISNFISSISKANTELSVCLTAISTTAAIIMTPFNFWVYGNLYIKAMGLTAVIPELSIPLWDVFKTIVILLGIPLVLGILTTQFLPRFAIRMKKPFRWVSVLFFVALVVLSFIGNMNAFLKCIKYIFLIVLIHNALALLIGFCTGSAFKLSKADRRTLTIETGIQNSGLGLVLLLGTQIFADLPPHGGMLVITAWWGIWHIISGLSVASIFNLTDKKRKIK